MFGDFKQPFPISKDVGKNHPIEPANHKELLVCWSSRVMYGISTYMDA